MLTTTILENDYVNLVFYPEHKILHHTWLQHISGESLHEALLLGTETLRENDADKWLSDDRQNVGGLSEEDFQWGVENWFPQTKAIGWKYWALVVPDTQEARASMIEAVQYFNQQGVVTRTFIDLDEALKWLKTV